MSSENPNLMPKLSTSKEKGNSQRKLFFRLPDRVQNSLRLRFVIFAEKKAKVENMVVDFLHAQICLLVFNRLQIVLQFS